MKICVVVPTYNEAGTIGKVIARLLASTPDVDILVADDNSPDGTGKFPPVLFVEPTSATGRSRPASGPHTLPGSKMRLRAAMTR